MQTPIQHVYRSSHEGDGLFYAWFLSMHTRVDIILCSRKSEEELLLTVDHIYDTLCQLEKTANYYDPTSELARVNRTAATSPVVLSEELYAMIDLCLEYNKKTLGCFDITVLSNNYDRNTIHSVQLSAEERSVFFRQPGVTLNLSGFLKGYALEKIKSILKESMIENALINMGNSSVLALGNHPMGKGWKINFGWAANASTNVATNAATDASTNVTTNATTNAATDTVADTAAADASANADNPQSILLYNECLTTSGNESSQRKHIISPRSGEFVKGARQIAVVTADGAIGEILSTGLFAADDEQLEALLAEFSPLLNAHFCIGY